MVLVVVVPPANCGPPLPPYAGAESDVEETFLIASRRAVSGRLIEALDEDEVIVATDVDADTPSLLDAATVLFVADDEADRFDTCCSLLEDEDPRDCLVTGVVLSSG